MGDTTPPTTARYALLTVFGAILLTSLWSSGSDVGSVDAAQPDEPFDVRLLAVPDDDQEPWPERLALELALESAPGGVAPESERPDSDVPLTSGALRATVKRLETGLSPVQGVEVLAGTRVRVEVLHSLGAAEIEALVTGLGGSIEGEVPGILVQALVPYDRLVQMEAHPGVQSIRTPLQANVPLGGTASADSATAESVAPAGVTITGQEVAKMNADDWQAAGITGTGVKIGIVDVFDGTLWNIAQAAGELPAPAGTFCQVGGTPCNIWTIAPGAQHGEGVGEIIHEMAPAAQIYLATAVTAADLQAAVTYFAGQGVDIVSRSMTAQYDGPGDGTGPIAAVIDNAVANGMAWFNSAGNAASDGVWNLGFGQYWRGGWVDTDFDLKLEFAPGDERMGFVCAFANGLRWNDFGVASPTDYDFYVYDDVNDTVPFWGSVDDQTSGAPPIETNFNCTGAGNIDFLEVRLFSAGGGTAGDVLEFMMNQGLLEHWQNPYSGSGPASDTASAGGLSIGAIDPPLGTTIAPYSSQGPTNDGRTKPDLSAAACVSSFTYSPSCFDGTSAATPAAAGAAALVLDANLATTPAQLKTYLLNNATTDRGAAGTDNVYGKGELILPPPPDADGDGVPDGSDNCPYWYNPTQVLPSWPIPADDPDCDGFTTAVENFVGTDPTDSCANTAGANDEADDRWPADTNDNRSFNVLDLPVYIPALNSLAPGPPYAARLDLNMSGGINIFDLVPLIPMVNKTCSP